MTEHINMGVVRVMLNITGQNCLAEHRQIGYVFHIFKTMVSHNRESVGLCASLLGKVNHDILLLNTGNVQWSVRQIHICIFTSTFLLASLCLKIFSLKAP